MQKEWWMTAVQWAVWGIAMTLVMGALSKSRIKQAAAIEANTLKHPRAILIIGIIGFALFVGFAVVSNTIARNDSTSIGTTLIFLFFAALSLAMVAEYYLARHRLSPEGLDYGRLLGKRGFVSWGEIRSIDYSQSMKWFRLRTDTGVTVRISAMLIGLPEFAQQVLAHVPNARIHAVTRDVLKATAAGYPPSIWK